MQLLTGEAGQQRHDCAGVHPSSARLATCIATTGLADILSKKLSRLLGGHKLALGWC